VLHTDEHNFRTLGCYRRLLPPDQAFVWGREAVVSTPHLDWLAREGATVERFYAASPVCTPSRASLVSGREPQNTGAIRNNLPMSDEIVTFAEVLRREGYATGYAGKWHLDGEAKPGWAPERKFGFDDNRYLFNRGHWKQLEETASDPRVKARSHDGKPTYAVEGADAQSFTTDFLADRTVEFIRRHARQPFCFMVSFPDPHGPNTVRSPYDTMFDGLRFEQPRTARESGKDLPSWGRTPPDRFNQRQMSRYFGMVKCIDDNVGKIVNALRSAGRLTDTIVVFTADHGDMCGEHGRHNKGIPLDGSVRIPFVIRAAGIIPPNTVVRAVLSTTDFKPTILALMGFPGDGRDDGRDASDLFRTGQTPLGWKDIAFSRIGTGRSGWIGAFTSRYKLVVSPADDPCLFDLQTDPDELNNVFRVPSYRAVVRELGLELSAWAQASGEPHWGQATVRSDLAWFVDGSGEYQSPVR
jgi:arylsulfatase A-like enzyme